MARRGQRARPRAAPLTSLRCQRPDLLDWRLRRLDGQLVHQRVGVTNRGSSIGNPNPGLRVSLQFQGTNVAEAILLLRHSGNTWTPATDGQIRTVAMAVAERPRRGGVGCGADRPQGLLAAQTTLVSPVQATTLGTTSANAFPFNSTVVRRYLQLHGDLGAGVKIISQLAFRQVCGTSAGGGARTMMLDMFVGDGIPVQNTNFNLDANYTSPKTQVMTNQLVNWGPIGARTACPGTSPFEAAMSLPLAPPFTFVGTGSNSFIWELAVYSNTGTAVSTNTYVTTNVGGVSAITGPGCGTMTHTATAFDHGGILSLNFTVTAAPISAYSVAALGATNPVLPFPGLCSPLLTDVLLTLPIGNTTATGTITTTQAEQATFVMPNPIPGFTLFTQVHTLDVASAFPIPLANSNGRSVVVPVLGSNPGLVARVFNNAGGTTAPSGVYFSTSTIGYGLVTEITY